jgi:dTDP-4-dehydrorhamnose reductase
MKVLILGSKGMLGHDLAYVFSSFKPILFDKEELDITKEAEVKKILFKLKPSLIINAAAYTDVDKAEEEKEEAFKVNAEAIKYLADASCKIKAVFIHFSTDYVFDGNKKEGYKEDDKPFSPLNIYGFSKLKGEEYLKKFKDLKFYLIRTSWLFGPRFNPHNHKNFVDAILKKANKENEIKVVDDQFGSPTYTFDLAKATLKLIIEKKYPFGVYHLTNSGVTNWYEFAKKIIEFSNLEVRIIPCSSEEIKRPAKRPKYSILINTKFPKLRNWQSALKEYLKINK